MVRSQVRVPEVIVIEMSPVDLVVMGRTEETVVAIQGMLCLQHDSCYLDGFDRANSCVFTMVIQ